LTARDECHVLAGSGQLCAEVSACAACPVDRNTHLRAHVTYPRQIAVRAANFDLPHSALQVIETTGLVRNLSAQVRYLSHGLKQALELSMVLALEPSVLPLDEPTAGLTKHERKQIGAILIDLAGQHGLCVLLIEHDLEFVREISSRIIVLHQGHIVLNGSVDEVVNSETVRTIYSGQMSPPHEVAHG
jgi:ABC-type uncharacterized transport system ATPase subunit